MKSKTKIIIIAALVVFVGAVLITGGPGNGQSSSPRKVVSEDAADTGSIKWLDYEAGMKKIKSEKTPGLIYFYTDWCSYCQMMDNKTFTNPDVTIFLNSRMVPIRVNAEENASLSKEYNASRFPLLFFISGEGEIISQQPGYIPPEMLMHMLKFIETGSYRSMEFREFMEGRK